MGCKFEPQPLDWAPRCNTHHLKPKPETYLQHLCDILRHMSTWCALFLVRSNFLKFYHIVLRRILNNFIECFFFKTILKSSDMTSQSFLFSHFSTFLWIFPKNRVFRKIEGVGAHTPARGITNKRTIKKTFSEKMIELMS